MKFSTAIAALGLASIVSCSSAAPELHPEDNEGGHYVDTKQELVPFNYEIGYEINGKPTADVIELYNGEEITLNYTFINNEDIEVSVVGVGGNFANPATGEVVANISDAKIGPITIPPGEAKVFNQRVGINLPMNNYLLTPGLYVVRESSLALLGAKTQLAIVSEPPISFFSPQLLFLEFLLVATIGVGIYFVYITYGVNYFQTTAKTGSAPVRSTTTGSGDSRPRITTTASGKKVVDESWLPEHHVKQVNKRKAK